MNFKRYMGNFAFNKMLFGLLAVLLLSGTALYGDILPFGLPALSVWGNGPFSLLAYVVSLILAKVGFLSYLRHVFSFVFYVLFKRFLSEKLPDFIIMGCSVLLGGTLSLLFLKEDSLLHFSFAFAEAVFSALIGFVFRKAKEAYLKREDGKKISEAEFAFIVITLMCFCLSFSDIETGRMSISAMLMVLIGMASAYAHKAPVSGAVNMAAGFFALIFTPMNASSVAYMTLSGFSGAVLKKYGKFTVPLTYMMLLPVFSLFGVDVTTFYLEDIFVASALFLVIPGRFLNVINMVPNTKAEEESCLRLSDRINSLADAFFSVPEIFSGQEFRVKGKELKDASKLTVEAVCADCFYAGKCSFEAEYALKQAGHGNVGAFNNSAGCIRKRELFSAFKSNYRLLRMENMWHNYMEEENEALKGQMTCIADTLRKLSEERELKLLKDASLEYEIKSGLKKQGINVKRVSAGRNLKGVFCISLEMVPCKGKELCDEEIPKILEKILGFEVTRYGMKGCSVCRASYKEISGFRIDTGVSSAALEEVSGDSFLFSYVDEEHFAAVLSDGMGTGSYARYKSRASALLIANLLSAGMNIKASVNMVNSLLLRQGGRDFATLDIILINTEKGEAVFSKNASASGYILKCGGRVTELEAGGNPVGILGSTEAKVDGCRINEGDFLIMVSDGVADCFMGENDSLKDVIGEFTGGSAQNLSDFILAEALGRTSCKARDDMTVVAVGCIKKQKSGKDKGKGGLVYEKRQKSDYFR